ncbi:MAG: PAS domain S-box protein, partial [Deltaproteobacteria bacterium]|nr:PAS domain S-box protein [Deltaproteobacteria bacterium]
MNEQLLEGWTARCLAAAPVVSVPRGWVASSALELACRQGLEAVVVVSDGGAPIGALTREVLESLPPTEGLGNVARRHPVRIVPMDTSVSEAVSLLVAVGGSPLVLVDDMGKPVGVVDVTRALQGLFAQLERLRTRLEAVLETVGEAVTLVDENEVVVGWSRQAAELYGICAPDILGRPIRTVSEFHNLMVTRVMEERREVRGAYQRSAEETYVLINARPVESGGRLLGGVAAERDITELVRLHEELSRVNDQVRALERRTQMIEEERGPFRRILGHSWRLRRVIELAHRVAATDASVLIRGESGTGKELFAEAIHRASPRAAGPFVVIHCGAVPPTLFESELFGYQPGSFTGADRRGRQGKFELAHGGTVFLDEVGELQPDLQVKLLRVLEKRAFYRIGGGEPIQADVRVLAATNRDLDAMVRAGRFRQDLYYRLNVVSLELPSLRDRRDDIPELVYAFLQEFARVHNRNVVELAPEVLSALLRHEWPGNVRELRNVVERLVVLSEGGVVGTDHL